MIHCILLCFTRNVYECLLFAVVDCLLYVRILMEQMNAVDLFYQQSVIKSLPNSLKLHQCFICIGIKLKIGNLVFVITPE